VRVESTRYAVPGWGAGELWTRGDVVLAHEFHYGALSPPAPPVPPAASLATPTEGAHAPPTDTLAGARSRGGDDFVSISRRRGPGVETASRSELIERFRAFFAGDVVAFGDVEIDLSWATPFQRELTAQLRAIPRGEVVTYGELAALAGRPGAARAAGTFCATNRFAIVVPCHRVVAADGIGGYGPDGVPVKRRLLALEGVSL
jgi:methylated-DNA-[protein]-cysteine S-methyltransferase